MNTPTNSNLIYLIVFLLMCLFVSSPVYAQMDLNEAINVAGKQRMLTQRMLKNYVMLGMGNSYGNPGQDLQKNIALFDQSLADLKTIKINDDVESSLKSIEQQWLPLKVIMQQTPNKSKVVQLQYDLDLLLSACHKTTQIIAASSGVNSSDIINISGRQRMLSQRLAALYMLKVWGIQDTEFRKKLNTAMEEFTAAQTTLLDSEHNTQEIITGLNKVKKLFKWFEVMGRSESGKYAPAIISKSADKILNEMNNITSMYVKSVS